jgi:cytochrome c oxidase subunit II
MQQIPVSLLTLTAGILITLISLWVGQNHGLMPEQASEQAPLVDGFFNIMVTIGTALFLVVQGAILIFSFKFRRPLGDETDGEPIEGNFSLEVFWTAIPAVIVIGLGVYSVEVYQQMGGVSAGSMMAMSHSYSSQVSQRAGRAIAAPLIADASIEDEATISPSSPSMSQRSDPNSPPIYGLQAKPAEVGETADLTVNVTGIQFAWIFNYPNSGVTAGELHVPIGQDVRLNLVAQDVIHSFWVPQFRIKQDAIPGEKTELRFVATRLGEYPVVCTELCGSYHGAMRTKVVVHTPEGYQQWLTDNQIAATSNLQKIVSLAPASLTSSEFLAPYAQEMGITTNALAHIHHASP